MLLYHEVMPEDIKRANYAFFDRIDPLKIPNSTKILRHPKGSSISSIVIFFDNAS